jgi:hypothetical protein
VTQKPVFEDEDLDEVYSSDDEEEEATEDKE